MILDSSKKETPCFHRPVSIQIDSSLPQRVPQPVSRGSDVALHNKSPPKTHILPVLPVILDSSKKETPCFHRPVSIQIDSPLPQGVTQSVLRRSDVAIHNKSPPKTHILPVLPEILDRSKKETPCFHRPVSIQIDSPLSQGVPQPVSRRSDVALHNKSPPKTHILPVLPVILDRSKKETPCFHRPVSIQIDSPLPQGVTQSVLRRSDVALHNKSPSKTHILPVLPEILDRSKKETPCFHRPVSIQIDSPLPQGVPQPVSRRSDVALHNKSPQNIILYLFCL